MYIIPYQKIGEASTELLERDIYEIEKISYQYKERPDISALIRINGIIKIEKSNFDFAQVLYNKDIQDRYFWLENKVKRNLLYYGKEYKKGT